MVKLTDGNGKLSIDVQFCKKLDLKLIDGNYLLVDLRNSEIHLHRNRLCCDGCGTPMIGGMGYFGFKGIFFCRECLESIQNGKIGMVIY